MAGRTLAEQGATREVIPDYYSVKEAIFPFLKFQNVDPILGPEMRSTGEVMGVGRDFGAAFGRAHEAAGIRKPPLGKVFLSVRDADKDRLLLDRPRHRRQGLRPGRHARHLRLSSPGTASSASTSTRCSRAGRTSST